MKQKIKPNPEIEKILEQARKPEFSESEINEGLKYIKNAKIQKDM